MTFSCCNEQCITTKAVDSIDSNFPSSPNGFQRFAGIATFHYFQDCGPTWSAFLLMRISWWTGRCWSRINAGLGYLRFTLDSAVNIIADSIAVEWVSFCTLLLDVVPVRGTYDPTCCCFCSNKSWATK